MVVGTVNLAACERMRSSGYAASWASSSVRCSRRLARKDQRAKAALYLRGLMLDGRRKSMQPMAARLRVDHQRLQQFVTSSPWDVEPVRQTLARKACALIEPHAWVIDDTGFVKDGAASPGVARQYSGTLGKVGNCQIAVSVHAVSDAASRRWTGGCSCPTLGRRGAHGDPHAAAAVAARRVKRAQIPDTERHRPKWQLALEMIDELVHLGTHPARGGRGRRLRRDRPLPARADRPGHPLRRRRQGRHQRLYQRRGARSDMPAPTGKAGGLRSRATATRPVQPGPGRGLPADAAREGVLAAGHQGRPRQPSRGDAHPFLARRIRPANRTPPQNRDGSLPDCWLLAEWPTGADEPTDYWLSTLARTPPRRGAGPPGQRSAGASSTTTANSKRPRPRPLRRTHLDRLAPPRHPRHRRPPLPHHPAADRRPKSHGAA